jgi:hypothetical protein
MPVYDSVVLIAERSAIPLLPAPKEPPKSE